MTTSTTALSALLREGLELDLPPVALALADAQPAGIARSGEVAPAACAFWRRAELGVFYATAADHLNCPIGAMVLGFELPETETRQLLDLVGQMCDLTYLRPEEVPRIPKFERAAAGIVYGPLADFPGAPDVVLVWATPAQAMILQEAAGAARWAETPLGAIFGRPACGALPTARARGQVTVSLGCLGMRTFTEIPADRCLVAIPGAALDSLAEDLQRTLAANRRLGEYYQGRQAQFAPTR